MRHVEAEIAGNTAANIEIEVIEPNRLQIDQDIVGADLRCFNILVDELFRSTMLLDNNRFHYSFSPI